MRENRPAQQTERPEYPQAETPPAVPVRISGIVKWFDATKGYGFVTPGDDLGDILIHYKLLAPLKRKSLPDGTSVTLYVRNGPRGRQGTEILELDFSTAAMTDDQSGGRATATPPAVVMNDNNLESVQVCWFNRTKGYGFLLKNDGITQVFIHMETVRRSGFGTLAPGQQVLAAIENGPRGAHAVAIHAATASSGN